MTQKLIAVVAAVAVFGGCYGISANHATEHTAQTAVIGDGPAPPPPPPPKPKPRPNTIEIMGEWV